MDFDTMIDHIEKLQADKEAGDVLDEKRLRALVAQYGEKQGQALFAEKYGLYGPPAIKRGYDGYIVTPSCFPT